MIKLEIASGWVSIRRKEQERDYSTTSPRNDEINKNWRLAIGLCQPTNLQSLVSYMCHPPEGHRDDVSERKGLYDNLRDSSLRSE